MLSSYKIQAQQKTRRKITRTPLLMLHKESCPRKKMMTTKTAKQNSAQAVKNDTLFPPPPVLQYDCISNSTDAVLTVLLYLHYCCTPLFHISSLSHRPSRRTHSDWDLRYDVSVLMSSSSSRLAVDAATLAPPCNKNKTHTAGNEQRKRQLVVKNQKTRPVSLPLDSRVPSMLPNSHAPKRQQGLREVPVENASPLPAKRLRQRKRCSTLPFAPSPQNKRAIGYQSLLRRNSATPLLGTGDERSDGYYYG